MSIKDVFEAVKTGSMSLEEFTRFIEDEKSNSFCEGYDDGYNVAASVWTNL